MKIEVKESEVKKTMRHNRAMLERLMALIVLPKVHRDSEFMEEYEGLFDQILTLMNEGALLGKDAVLVINRKQEEPKQEKPLPEFLDFDDDTPF